MLTCLNLYYQCSLSLFESRFQKLCFLHLINMLLALNLKIFPSISLFFFFFTMQFCRFVGEEEITKGMGRRRSWVACLRKSPTVYMSMAFDMFLALVLLCLEMWLSLGLRLVVVVVVVLCVCVSIWRLLHKWYWVLSSEAHTVFHLVVLTISWQFQNVMFLFYCPLFIY